ncbi:MAG: hypothetical protein WCW03_03770 [Candidatus Paceibacterota bacterium]|jgi:hypothetical protein
MYKKVITGIVLVIIIVVLAWLFIQGNKQIGTLDESELISYTLKQKEVKSIIADETVIRSQVDSITQISIENRNIMSEVAPHCLDKAETQISQTIRSVSINTPTRQIGVIWSPATNSIACVSWTKQVSQ